MKIVCFLPYRTFRRTTWMVLGPLLACAGSPRLAMADNLPVSAPQPAPAETPANAPTPPPAAATPASSTAPAPAPTTTATVPTAPTPTTPAIPVALHVRLPLTFADFAADFHPQELHPEWLTVQIGTLETVFSPPAGKAMFVLPELPQELADIFQPVEISCLLGAKSRFENLTQIDIDPPGHPLGYAVPLGKLVYVLARNEQHAGISFSFYYYESTQLHWLPDADKDGWFTPVTQATVATQDLMVPADGYVFVYLSNRLGPPRPDSTARPQALFTYLILHVHPVAPPAPALDAPGPATSTP